MCRPQFSPIKLVFYVTVSPERNCRRVMTDRGPSEETEDHINRLIATLKLQSNGPSHSNTMIGTIGR